MLDEQTVTRAPTAARLLLAPTRRNRTRWLELRVSLRNKEGGPLALKMTTSRFPSLLTSPNAVPRRDFRGPSFRPVRSEISSKVPFPRLRSNILGSPYLTSSLPASIRDEKLP